MSRVIQAVFPITPVQAGMLFHSQDEVGSGAYVDQLHCSLSGCLNPDAFRAAWEHMVQRHDIFRTAFVLDNDPQVQVVYSEAKLEWREHNWSEYGESEQRELFAQLLEQDRRRGFDPIRPPLMRHSLCRIASDRYRFLWTRHHATLDGWCMDLVFRELLACYHALAANQPIRLSPAVPYRNFAEWLRSRDSAAALEWWRRELSDFEEPSYFAEPGTGAQLFDRQSEHVLLEETDSSELGQFTRTEQITIASLFQGALSLFLARQTYRDDVLFGLTIAGRAAEFSVAAETIGPCIQTIPIRAKIDWSVPLRDWLRAFQSRLLDSQQHGHLSLAEISRLSAHPPGTPLFDGILVVENYPRDAALFSQHHDSEIRIEDVGTIEQTHYPVTLIVTPGKRWLMEVVFDRRRFSRERAGLLLSGIFELLDAFPKNLHKALGAFGLARKGALGRLREFSFGPEPSNSPGGLVHQWFEEQARRRPSHPAVRFQDEVITYLELDGRANRLAHALRSFGVSPEAAVGICLSRSIDLVVAVIATLKAGGAYVPLDPEYPTNRLQYMLEDSQARVVITAGALAERLGLQAGASLLLDANREWIAQQPETPPAVALQPENALYIIYTSGSTGRPKGILLSHGALANLISWHLRTLHNGARTLQFASLSFDASFHEIFAALASGGELCVLSDTERFNPEALFERLAREKTEKVILPVALFQEIAQLGVERRSMLPCLTELITTGEQLILSAAMAQFLQGHPSCRIHNHYGPSETHVVTAFSFDQPPPGPNPNVSIGRPIDRTEVYIVDRAWELVPAGMTGELFFGGANLGRNYVQRADLTAAKFLPNPFFDAEGARIYRTGDLGRFRSDGNIDFLGRIDHQVKIRGFRIELGEVEAALKAHANVKAAAVILEESTGRERRLAAYVAPKRADERLSADLRRFLEESLPSHMIPVVGIVSELPLTVNGKLDRGRLPSLRPEASRRGALPCTPTEELVSATWMQVLKCDNVQPEDDFFELGGHSLLAAQVASRCQTALNASVDARLVLECRTVARLARELESRRAKRIAPPSLTAVADPSQEAFPLSPAQRRFWLLHQLEASINVPGALKLSGPLDLGALRLSLERILGRHEIFRTTFRAAEMGPVQWVDDSPVLEFGAVELDDLTPEARETELDRLLAFEVGRPFDLERLPLCRFRIIGVGHGEHWFVYSFHHIVFDAWSHQLFQQELADLYPKLLSRREPGSRSSCAQYRDYAHWQQRLQESGEIRNQLAWWKEHLADAPQTLALPRRSNPNRSAGRPKRSHLFSFTAECDRQMRLLARKEGITLFGLTSALVNLLLFRWTGQSDMLIATPVSQRDRIEWESLLGLCLNTICLRTRIRGNCSFLDFLRRVHAGILAALSRRDVPFESVLTELRKERPVLPNAFLDVVVVFHYRSSAPVVATDLKIEPKIVQPASIQHDLVFGFIETGDRLSGSIDYDESLFSAESIGRMARDLGLLASQALGNPMQLVGNLSLGDIQSARRAGAPAFADSPGIISLIEAMVSRRGEATAVRRLGQTTSYRELNAQANRIASLLRLNGVTAEERVAVLVEPGANFVAAILGVLKAGAAFVPLEPTHPPRRREMILKDSRPKFVLTERKFSAEDFAGIPGLMIEPVGELAPLDGLAAFPPGDDNLAYVMYTSGSTGEPKGVMAQHGGLRNLALAQVQDFEISAGSVVLQFASVGFDASISEIFTSLLAGATLCIARWHEFETPNDFAQFLVEESIEVATLPPSVWLALAPESLPRLRTAVSAGESCPPLVAERWGGGRLFVNAYGPTEATVCATRRFRPVPADVAIGEPLPNTSISILQHGFEPAPTGCEGEIVIGGRGVARGYLGNPALTAERFVCDPWALAPGQRMYRTGDLGRMQEDGTLHFCGRHDNQVKLRGVRVELAEIENAFLGHPGIYGAAVVRVETGGGSALVAFAQFRPEPARVSPPSDEAMRVYLRERLPEMLLPARIHFCESLPLTPSGKVDRRRLESLAAQRAVEGRPPTTDLERQILEIWRSFLGNHVTGVDQNFFEVGGHSIAAAQIISRLRTEAGVTLQLREFFAKPTISALAESAAALGARSGPLAPVIPAEELRKRIQTMSADDIRQMIADRRKRQGLQELWTKQTGI